NIYHKLPEEILYEEDIDRTPLVKGQAKDLLDIFKKLILEQNFEKTQTRVHSISKDPITIYERIGEIEDLFKVSSQLSFLKLFKSVYSTSDIVLTFLALLEMLKANQVILYQEEQFQDIIIR